MSKSNAARFTAGPWHVNVTISGKIKVDSATGVRIAGLPQRDGHGKVDAHLIAASPSLYAALERAKDSLALFYDSTEDNNSDPIMQRVGLALESARAALAQARGEASK